MKVLRILSFAIGVLLLIPPLSFWLWVERNYAVGFDSQGYWYVALSAAMVGIALFLFWFALQGRQN